MNLIWVLIIVLHTPHGAGVTTAEFYGKQACEAALDAAQGFTDNVNAVCVNKGVGK